MLFKPELREKIMRQEKTQTRRPKKDGESLVLKDGKKTVLTSKGHVKMQVGRVYSIQYKYGKPCVWWHPEKVEELKYETLLDIQAIDTPKMSLEEMGYKKLKFRLLDIREEPILSISLEDAIAEGFKDRQGFWDVWHGFYDNQCPVAFAYTFEVA